MRSKLNLKNILNFALKNIIDFSYIFLIILSFLVVPYHNIRTGFTNWGISGFLEVRGPVNVGALTVQRAFTLALIVFYIYRLRLKRKIRDENIEIDLAIQESEDRRHHVEREYFKLKRQMQDIFDTMDDFVFIISKDFKIEFINKAAKNVFGEWAGKKCYEFIYKNKEMCPWCISGHVFDGEFVSWEHKHQINNKFYRVSNSPFINPDGSVSMISIYHDITREKEIQKQVQLSEEYFRNLFENLPIACFGYDREAKIIAWNKAASKLYGFNKEEVLGRSMFETIAQQKDYEKTVYYINEVFNGKSFDGLEWEDKDSNGIVRFVYTNTYPLCDLDGKILMGISANIDITMQKRTEQEIAEKEERYRTFLENIPIHIGAIDEFGKFIIWNKYSEGMLGYSKEEVIGKMAPVQLHETEQEAKEVIETAIQKGIFDKELKLVHKNGKRMQVRLVVVPNRANGKIVGFYGFAEDISRRKETEKELTATKEKLESIVLKDPLTELYNNRYAVERLASEFERSKRSFSSLSLLLIDLDYFKSINDTYGYEFGDRVLVQVAKLLKSELRVNDIISRWGGEEFMVIIPDVDRANAISVGKKILRVFGHKGFGDEKNIVNLKCSIGIASYPEDPLFTPGELIEAVEKTVFKVKGSGGDGIGSYSYGFIKDVDTIVISDKERLLESLKRKMSFFAIKGDEGLLEAVYALSKSLELKDHTTRKHSEKTIHYAVKLAKRFGMNDIEIEDLRRAAILHDIGKLGIPDKILLKEGVLVKEEFDIVKQHPEIAASIMSPLEFLKNSIPYVLYHHERYDGKGYPKGLKGDEIPLGARIVSIVDVYEALTSDRPYHKALSKQEALKIIKDDSGAKFDPKLVNEFINLLESENIT